MDITQGLQQYLLAQSSISNVVKTVQPAPAPEILSDYPVIVYKVASYLETYNLSGSDGIAQSRIVFDAFAPTYGVARTLALNVIVSVSGLTYFTLPDGTVVQRCEVLNMQDGFVEGNRLYQSTVHAMFFYSL